MATTTTLMRMTRSSILDFVKIWEKFLSVGKVTESRNIAIPLGLKQRNISFNIDRCLLKELTPFENMRWKEGISSAPKIVATDAANRINLKSTSPPLINEEDILFSTRLAINGA